LLAFFVALATCQDWGNDAVTITYTGSSAPFNDVDNAVVPPVGATPAFNYEGGVWTVQVATIGILATFSSFVPTTYVLGGGFVFSVPTGPTITNVVDTTPIPGVVLSFTANSVSLTILPGATLGPGTLSSVYVISFAGAGGDPHVNGPNGESFDFFGQADAFYNMFASKQLVLNAHFMASGPQVRFMTEFGVMFGNVSLVFNTWHKEADFYEKTNALLAPLGAQAVGDHYQTTLELCAAHSITITQKRTTTRPSTFYLDVAFSVPGCHDDFGGFLGQMYQCKYSRNVSGSQQFVWDASTEESFRVPSLKTTVAPFDANTECYAADQFGAPFAAHGGLQHK